MSTQQQAPDDAPLMLAWKAYRATEEAKNSEKWARTFVTKADPDNGAILVAQPHLEGSLWAAFVAGFTAAQESS